MKTSDRASDGVELVKQKHGGSLRVGGTGAVGRPRGDFTEFCRTLMSSPKAQEWLRRVLEDPKHRHYANVLKLVAAYGFGKPDQHVEVDLNPPVFYYPEPVRDTSEWVEIYGPMLHRAHET